jgi:glucose 1-dehydrogenase
MREIDYRSNGLLKGRVAIITGAAKGIGRGIAIEMAREGAYVVIADIDEEGSKRTGELVKEFGRGAFILPTDVSNEEHNNRLVDDVLKQFGKIDILVNNAGINIGGSFLEISKEAAMSVLKTNLLEPFFLTQRVAREMVQHKTEGCILFTSSIHGQIPHLHPAYTVSKAALDMFVRDTALELADYGIRVNAVAPGAIAIRDELDRTFPLVPLGSRGTPTDIAHAMVFLASAQASYITGQILVVDGGLSLAHRLYWAKKGLLR